MVVETAKEQTRVRMNYKVSAKGVFQPDITAEAETVETATRLLRNAYAQVEMFAKEKGELGHE